MIKGNSCCKTQKDNQQENKEVKQQTKKKFKFHNLNPNILHALHPKAKRRKSYKPSYEKGAKNKKRSKNKTK